MEGSFIGRGEYRVRAILATLLQFHHIRHQVNIKEIVTPAEYAELGKELQKHNFDFVLIPENERLPRLVFEVNFKHGAKAVKKWLISFLPAIQRSGYVGVAMNHYECKSIFDTKEERPLRWRDYIDVINALDLAGVKP